MQTDNLEQLNAGYLNAIRAASRSNLAMAAQIDLALRESRPAMERLGAALARMGLTLKAMEEDGAPPAGAALDLSVELPGDWALTQLRKDYATAVEDLQFHDRMVQHLTLLRDYLGGVGGLLAGLAAHPATDASLTPAGLNPVAWSALRLQLMGRLLSPEQRQLLQVALPDGLGAWTGTAEEPGSPHARPGSVELF